MSDITLDQAHKIVQAAREKAVEIGTKMDIAVVDAGANLKFFIRMDKAWIGSIDIAIKKQKPRDFLIWQRAKLVNFHNQASHFIKLNIQMVV